MMKKPKPHSRSEDEIDAIVLTQADDETAWTKPILVRQPKPAAVSLPPHLATQAAFFAHLHRERDLAAWVRRVVQERLDWEEAALAGVKRRLRAKRA